MAFNFEQCTTDEISEFNDILDKLKEILTTEDKNLLKENIFIYFSDTNKISTLLKLFKNTKNVLKLLKANESNKRQSSTSKEEGDTPRFQIINSKIKNINMGNSPKENSSTTTDSEKYRVSCEELKSKYEELIQTSKETETKLNTEISSLKSELEKENTSHEELKKKYDTLAKISHEKEGNSRTVNLCLKTEFDKLKMDFNNLSLIHENVIIDSNEKIENLQDENLQLKEENRTLNNALNDRNICFAETESSI